MGQKTLLAVVGPTAIGKTSLAIDIATYYKTEIISADSRQFFKEMHIGTAVPSATELEQIPHHFIQHKSISESYSVGEFEKESIQRLKLLFKNNDVAVLVGGSGLYVNAVISGLDTFPKVTEGIRRELNATYTKEGISSLQEKLKKLDPQYYETVDLQNPHRLIRALEVCMVSGKSYSSFLRINRAPRSFKTIVVGLSAPRELLYQRINKRVDEMMDKGLLEEVRILYRFNHYNSLKTVGYTELFKHLEGEWNLDYAISEIKKNTRRFAKRQLTWFRKNKHILWFQFDVPHSEILIELDKELNRISRE